MNEISIPAVLAIILAASPDAALMELVKWRESLPVAERDRVPAVTLHLASGVQLSGVPVAVEVQASGDGAVRLVNAEGGKSELDVLHVQLRAIEAVTIHHNEHSLRHFAPSVELSARPVPSDFQMRRALEETTKALQQATGSNVVVMIGEGWPQSDFAKRLAFYAVEKLAPALREIASDEMGKAALKQKVNAVRVDAISDVGPTAKVEDGTLVIGIDVREAKMTLPDESTLKKKVENAL